MNRIINIFMLRQKSVQYKNKSRQMKQQSEQPKRGAKKEKPYSCKCGKQYGSLAAVDTHIKTKHLQHEKQYRQAISKPGKDNGSPCTKEGIRIKNIDVNKLQVQFMCAADQALKNIYQLMHQQNRSNQDILLNANQTNSLECYAQFQNSEDSQDIGLIPQAKTKRDKQVYQLVQDRKKGYQIEQIDSLLYDAQEFYAFKISKFKLSMVKELIKNFNLDNGSNIQLQLQIIAAKKRIGNNEKLFEKLSSVEQQIWEKIQIRQHLQKYYSVWTSLYENIEKKNQLDPMPKMIDYVYKSAFFLVFC